MAQAIKEASQPAKARPSANKVKPSYKHIPHSQKPPHLVAKRNARERRRVEAVNNAFHKLRKCVPIENRNKRVSKVKTLQRAIDYIRKLERILAEDDNSSAADDGAAASQSADLRQSSSTASASQRRARRQLNCDNPPPAADSGTRAKRGRKPRNEAPSAAAGDLGQQPMGAPYGAPLAHQPDAKCPDVAYYPQPNCPAAGLYSSLNPNSSSNQNQSSNMQPTCEVLRESSAYNASLNYYNITDSYGPAQANYPPPTGDYQAASELYYAGGFYPQHSQQHIGYPAATQNAYAAGQLSYWPAAPQADLESSRKSSGEASNLTTSSLQLESPTSSVSSSSAGADSSSGSVGARQQQASPRPPATVVCRPTRVSANSSTVSQQVNSRASDYLTYAGRLNGHLSFAAGQQQQQQQQPPAKDMLAGDGCQLPGGQFGASMPADRPQRQQYHHGQLHHQQSSFSGNHLNSPAASSLTTNNHLQQQQQQQQQQQHHLQPQQQHLGYAATSLPL